MSKLFKLVFIGFHFLGSLNFANLIQASEP